MKLAKIILHEPFQLFVSSYFRGEKAPYLFQGDTGTGFVSNPRVTTTPRDAGKGGSAPYYTPSPSTRSSMPSPMLKVASAPIGAWKCNYTLI